MGRIDFRIDDIDQDIDDIDQDVKSIDRTLSSAVIEIAVLKKEMTIRFVVANDAAPFSKLDATTETWSGANVELAETLATEAGYSFVEFISLDDFEMSGVTASDPFTIGILDVSSGDATALTANGWEPLSFDPIAGQFGVETFNQGLLLAPGSSSLLVDLAILGFDASLWGEWAAAAEG